MNRSSSLAAHYDRDRHVWDACANTYERQIVGGHPDVRAYEAFEEDLFDRVLRHLAAAGNALRLYDVGCGSGRLHLRYGLQTTDAATLTSGDAARVGAARQIDPGVRHDPLLAAHLIGVGGIDFSISMLELGDRKLRAAGLSVAINDGRLSFDHGSAFDLPPFGHGVPVAVCCCNSIGVMQGREGAAALFTSMRRAVDPAGGVAIISAYRRAAVADQALGNYESTMDVCGQPAWLVPNEYPAPSYRKVPVAYKRARDPSPQMVVDVIDSTGATVRRGLVLQRDPEVVAATVADGHIRTETDYESRWYADDEFAGWIDRCWDGRGRRIDGARLDALRAEPVQLAVYDPERRLDDLFARWLPPG